MQHFTLPIQLTETSINVIHSRLTICHHHSQTLFEFVTILLQSFDSAFMVLLKVIWITLWLTNLSPQGIELLNNPRKQRVLMLLRVTQINVGDRGIRDRGTYFLWHIPTPSTGVLKLTSCSITFLPKFIWLTFVLFTNILEALTIGDPKIFDFLLVLEKEALVALFPFTSLLGSIEL